MTADPELPRPSPKDEMWRAILLRNTRASRNRRIHRRIPSSPRCKLCAAPFGGIGGLFMPLLGHPRWAKNPKYCAGCFRMLRDNHGGAIECSLLFADVRGSTALASVAAAGEILVTASAAAAADLPWSLERRSPQLKGKSELTEVAVLTVA